MSGVWGSSRWAGRLLIVTVAAMATACPRDPWAGLPPEVIETPELRPLPDVVREVEAEIRPSPCPPGTPCDDDDLCTFDDRCNLADRCRGEPYVCQTTGECTSSHCLGDGLCAELVLPDRCFIQGACLTAGEVNPANICTECIPPLSQSEWSADDANKCDDKDLCTIGDYCVAGVCKPGTEKIGCNNGDPCQPNCAGKECGGDGCGGSCGSCPFTKTCKSGMCKPADPQPASGCPGPEDPVGDDCGALTWDGCCDHKGRLYYCQLGQLYCIDCAAYAPECGWDQEHAWYECGTDGWPGPDGFPSDCP